MSLASASARAFSFFALIIDCIICKDELVLVVELVDILEFRNSNIDAIEVYYRKWFNLNIFSSIHVKY